MRNKVIRVLVPGISPLRAKTIVRKYPEIVNQAPFSTGNMFDILEKISVARLLELLVHLFSFTNPEYQALKVYDYTDLKPIGENAPEVLYYIAPIKDGTDYEDYEEGFTKILTLPGL